MVFAYTSGRALLAQQRKAILEGQFDVIVFLLATEADRSTLEELKGLARDLHNLTGEKCLVVAFMPPTKAPRGASIQIIDDVEEIWNPEKRVWEAFVTAMTQNAYDLARYFEVPFETLPCMVFVDPRAMDYVTLSLRVKPLAAVHQDLRRVFGDWYRSLDAFSDRERLRTLAATGLHDRRKTMPIWLRRAMDEVLREEVVPTVRGAVLAAVRTREGDTIGRATRALSVLTESPMNIQALVDFLERDRIVLEVDGRSVPPGSVTTWYDRLYQAKISTVVELALVTPMGEPPRFPFERICTLGSELHVKRMARTATKKIGMTVKWLNDLKSLVSPFTSH